VEGGARRSLETRLQRTLVAAIAATTAALAAGVFVYRVSERVDALGAQADFVASALAQDLELSVHARLGDGAATFERIRWVDGVGDALVDVVVFAPDGRAIAGIGPDGPLSSKQLAATPARLAVGVTSWHQRTSQQRIDPGRGPAAPAPDAPKAGPDDGAFDLDAALELDEVELEKDPSSRGEAAAASGRRGEVRVRLSALNDALSELYDTLLAGLLLGLAALFIVRRMLRNAVTLLAPAFDQAQAMRDGDFTQRTDAEYEELAALSDAFNRISGSLSDMIADVNRLALQVSATVERVQAETTAIQLGVSSELTAIDSTEEAVRMMRDSVELSAAKLRELTTRAESSSDDTALIADASRTTSEKLGVLAGEVERQRQSLGVLLMRSSSLSDSAELLRNSTTGAREVAQRVLVRLDAANAQAKDAAGLAGTAADQSRQGGKAIEDAVGRISDIAAHAGTMQGSLGTLLARVERMQPVLGAIDDVTASTSLLALNASILAAQAGVHGRPFQVVVDQLKALARQTSNLTAEVNEAVSEVLEQRGHTTQAGDALGAVVQASLDDARRAAEALQAIRARAEESRAVSQGIAETVEGQHASVQDALARIEESAGAGTRVEDAARSLVEESAVLEGVGKSFDDVVAGVMQASDVQSKLTSRVGDALRQVAGQVQTLAGAQERQDTDMERVLEAMGEIRSVAFDARDRAAALEDVVIGLRGRADELVHGLSRFRTPERNVAVVDTREGGGVEARPS
jgi:methyl-accepting chemotaxis protein